MRMCKCSIAARLVLFVCSLASYNADAANGECGDARLIEQSFSSGAAWALCAAVNDRHALEVTHVLYRAPGGSLRSVAKQLHVGQILVHYHDESRPRAQIVDDAQSRILLMDSRSCEGSPLMDTSDSPTLCSSIQEGRLLVKYAQQPALHSQHWQLSSALQRAGLIWTVSITFTEDGQITPALTLSGRAREKLAGPAFAVTLPMTRRNLPRATVLATWRVVFNLDDGGFDTVQQFDFPLDATLGNRRPMQITDLDKELFTTVDRDNFRGWRIRDPRGTAYYLDPFNSGFSFAGSDYNWARFDLALTREKACERHALNNTPGDENPASCGRSLDDFVNGEDLQNAHPVFWFSQSRTFDPGNEDWPAISNFHQSFTLLPHDWTPTSPFELTD